VTDFEGTKARLQLFHGMRCNGVIEFEAHVDGRIGVDSEKTTP